MNWLDVSFAVNGELVEAVAGLQATFAANGVTME